MTLEQYVDNIGKRYKLGNATEHTFRGDLQQLIESLVPEISATNEPKRQKCGAPDYILTKKDIPIGFIEAKDIGDKDLDGEKRTGNKEQFDRYKASLDNIFFTDYLDFHLYHDGQFVTKIAIAEIQNGKIIPLTDNFAPFTNLVKDFCSHIGQTIKSPKKLAEMMAGKARLLSGIIEKALISDEETNENSTLKDQMTAFKQILIHDITPKGFADVYAQTIAYGMFAARLHDKTLDDFSRQEAAELIPKSNPFLRKLFGYIAGPDIDDRIKWVVDSLADIFLATNIQELLKNFGKQTHTEDPIIHFYETFLSEYDPKLRKARGVWYTPQPVVDFIVRAVDDILKTEFALPQGLADNSKIKIKINQQGKEVEQEVHKVQILDPATGTGTFLAEVIRLIHKKFKGQQGIWSNYVENHLLPRLNGFELLMASYAMAHLKLDMLLTETGFKPTTNQRFRVYLTNSLEEHHQDTGTLFANWLSTEANEANHIKRDTPVMCIIGNPPYSGESANKGEWIMSLMEDYKKEPGGNEKLKEQNSKFINDDYVKFLRYGQHFIEKNGSGILAFINPHGFLDNPTFRGMRWNLLKTYDKIYTIDLHGNAKKKETTPDGSADINIFDIMQGVSINLFVKTGKKKANELGKVYHFDLFGKREIKYDFLFENSIKTIEYRELPLVAPDYFFVVKDFGVKSIYDKGFAVTDLFKINSLGIQTHRDSLSIDSSKINLSNRISDFYNLTIENTDILKKYDINENSEWQLKDKRIGIFSADKIVPIGYRPFDNQFIYNDKNIVDRLRDAVSKHIIGKANICLVVSRQCVSEWRYIFLSKFIIESNLTGTAGRFGSGNFFPLYLYPTIDIQQTINQTAERTPNLNMEIVNQIAEKLGMQFVNEKLSSDKIQTPLNLPKGETSSIDSSESLALSPSSGGVGEVGCSTVLKGMTKPGYITANPTTYNLIKVMRDTLKNNPTDAENIMWEYLKTKKTGFKIRRQHIIDDFITDFVCLSKKVVIEIDGKIHLKQKEYDELRTIRLNQLGYEVIRFTNEEVFANPAIIALRIKEILENKDDLQDEDKSDSSVLDDLVDGLNSSPFEDVGKSLNSPPMEGLGEVFAPIDILDYIYAVLHSPTYREKYKEFLKIDFPRVPYPKDKDTFWQLVKLGGEIRQIHLLESPTVEKFITQYPIDGNNVVGKTKYQDGNVFINDTQYFENVSETAWNFYIGGYQPAQKWLKDRKDRILEFEDILHYQKIVVALTETDRLMKEIDEIEIE